MKKKSKIKRKKATAKKSTRQSPAAAVSVQAVVPAPAVVLVPASAAVPMPDWVVRTCAAESLRLRPAGSRPLRWAAAGQKGGSGKSTLLAALAWEAKARGLRVLIVDADPQGTCRTWAAEAQDRGHPCGYRPDQVPEGPAVLVLVGTAASGEDDPAASAGAPLRLAWNDAAGQHCFAALGDFETRYGADLVLIDVPGRLDEEQAAALAVTDVVFLPCSQAWQELCALQESADVVRAAMVARPELRAVVVKNKFRPRTRLGAAAAAKLTAAQLPVAESAVLNRICYEEFMVEGGGPGTPVAQAEVAGLFDELCAFSVPLRQGLPGPCTPIAADEPPALEAPCPQGVNGPCIPSAGGLRP